MAKSNLLVRGIWVKDYDIFSLVLNRIRHWVRAQKGSPFEAAKGRYHLYVSMACPWSHRVILMRHLKDLEDVVSLSGVETIKRDESWLFSTARPDPLHPEFTHLYQIYTKHDPLFTGYVSVPVLWDKKKEQIVSTESADIMLMFNSEFNEFASNPELDFYPESLRHDIEKMNTLAFEANVGVYRCAMAETEAIYELAKKKLFEALDRMDVHLTDKQFLIDERITVSDLRLFPTLVRFDQIYYPLFRCNQRRIVDYPNLKNYLERLVQMPGFLDTVDWEENMNHYYSSFPQLDARVRPAHAVPEHLRR